MKNKFENTAAPILSKIQSCFYKNKNKNMSDDVATKI